MVGLCAGYSNVGVNKMTFGFSNFTIILLILLMSHDSYGITGDLDRDGDVDFDDFFIFADNFGRTGSPEELVYRDTVIIQDTLRVTAIDTVVFHLCSIASNATRVAGVDLGEVAEVAGVRRAF